MINLGIGTGLNLASSYVPSESHDNENLKTQLNLEVAYRINKTNKSDMLIDVKHRCSLFGIIGIETSWKPMVHSCAKALDLKPYKNYSLINGRI